MAADSLADAASSSSSSSSSAEPVASTYDDFERLLYADEPVNFTIAGEPAKPFASGFVFPTAAEVVDALRRDPDTRILPGRPPSDGATAASMLETRDGTQHLGGDVEAFAEWFRRAPLAEALKSPFSLAHFQLARFFGPGELLEGFDARVLEPWKAGLAGAGYAFDRCSPYIFISGARDVGAFHHDVSHVVAWQIEGTKRFCGYRKPRELHGPAERCKHGQSVTFPTATLKEEDVLAVTMRAGHVLLNQLLTPHWVQSPDESLAFSINFSHGGLRREGQGRGLCANEQELVDLCARDPAAADILEATAAEGLVDTRAAADYEAAHLASSSNFPLAALPQRTSELPPASGGGLWLVADEGEVDSSLACLTSGRGWRVHGSLTASAALWDAAASLGRLETGAQSRRLWSPSPHLPRTIEEIEARAGAREPWRAVDLGCGRGRDCIWLAQRGWHAVGVDNQTSFLAHLAAFAERQGAPVHGRVATELLDLRKASDDALRALLAPPLALVSVSRFMSRRLLDEVVRLVPAGCCVAVHHFTADAPSLKSGKPIKASDDERGLEPGELSRRYAAAAPADAPAAADDALVPRPRLREVLLDEGGELVDGGRPTCSFVGWK